MKKYQSISRYGKRNTLPTLDEDERIVIQEKLDGANASFRRVGNEIFVFSRNNQLNEENTLNGFYNWVQENVTVSDLIEDVIYFGEWTTKHKLNYGDNHKQFYLFDVYDVANELYQSFSVVKRMAKELNLRLVPVFYEGKFQSLEHIESFVGQSHLGEVGEGVVVKNYHYLDRQGNQVFSKHVSAQFSEVNQVKRRTAPNPMQDFLDQTLTEARVSKHLHKLVDEGRLASDYAIEDMGAILKEVSPEVYEDIIKEELDILLKLVKRQVGKAIPNVVKTVLHADGRA